MNILEAIADENLLGPFFDDPDTWAAWHAAMRVVYGLDIPAADHELIRECTGRDATRLPRDGFDTVLLLTGRRSGKSRIAATIATYEAVLSGRESKLSKGETGVVPIVSPTKSQSRVVKDYMRGIFEAPILAAEVSKETREGFELKNGTRIECLAGDFRTVRNFTCLAVVVDEAAFLGYADESKIRSDTELIRALKPSLATCGGRLIAISIPYAMKGWCYSTWKKHFGNDTSKTLVWNCPSRTMNPTLSQSIVDDALAEDPDGARAEYLGQFRDDIATFVPRDIVESAVVKGRTELLPDRNRRYAGFVDISGGRSDDAALAIAHKEGEKVILDYLRRWRPPFSPDRACAEMVEDVTRYEITRVIGDNYSAEFVKQSFESRGVRYARATRNPWGATLTAKKARSKSELYLELLPRLFSRQVELLDNAALVDQLCGLERRTRSGGRDSIDHGPNQHDDLANVLAGVVVCATQRRIYAGIAFADNCDDRILRERHGELTEEQETFLAGVRSIPGADRWR